MNNIEKCHRPQWIVLAGCSVPSPGLQHAAILCHSTKLLKHSVHYTQQKTGNQKHQTSTLCFLMFHVSLRTNSDYIPKQNELTVLYNGDIVCSPTNEELDKLRKHKNTVNYIKPQRLSWFGHVQRMPDTRTVKKIFKWKPLTKRSQGRPRYRWEDNTKQDICQMKIKNWVACIQDRGKWKDVIQKAKTFNPHQRKFSAQRKKKCVLHEVQIGF